MNSSTPTTPKPPGPLKVLVIGKPGSYKTTFLLQFFRGVHIINADNNLDGPTDYLMHGIKDKITGKQLVEPPYPNLEYTWDNIRTDDKNNVIDIHECFDRTCDKLQLFRTDPEYKKRSVIGVDSLSHINEFIIRKVMKMKNVESLAFNHWTDFATAAYTLLVAKLDQTGKPVICTAHLENVFEADDKNIAKKNLKEVNPLFSGRVGDSIGAYFTDVWMLEKRLAGGGKIEWILMTNRTGRCDHLKNTLGLPTELDITKGFSVLEPYLKGRI